MRLVTSDELRSALNLQAFLQHPPQRTATRKRRNGKAVHANSFTF